jgi:hypothetical protein
MAFESAWPELDFRDHVLVAGLPGRISPHYDLVHIVVSRPPIQPAERRRFLELCEALDFVVFHPVGNDSDGSNPYADLITTGDLKSYAEALPFSVLPARDDRPFQYTLDGPQLRRAAESGALLEVVTGFPLISLAVRIGTLALLVTAAPLAVLAARRRLPASGLRDVRSLLALFACIGFAYMAVEIAVLLKLQFYLGNPVYGLSVGLFAFLLSSSIGSYLSGSFPEALLGNRARIVVAWLLVVGIAFYGLSSFVFSETLAASLSARALIAVGIIFPLALPMGMLFPIGIRLLLRHSDEWIPWAWAINGCFSVLGIFGSRITALLLGFSRTLLLGLCVYAVVVACVAAASARPQRLEPPT